MNLTISAFNYQQEEITIRQPLDVGICVEYGVHRLIDKRTNVLLLLTSPRTLLRPSNGGRDTYPTGEWNEEPGEPGKGPEGIDDLYSLSSIIGSE